MAFSRVEIFHSVLCKVHSQEHKTATISSPVWLGRWAEWRLCIAFQDIWFSHDKGSQRWEEVHLMTMMTTLFPRQKTPQQSPPHCGALLWKQRRDKRWRFMTSIMIIIIAKATPIPILIPMISDACNDSPSQLSLNHFVLFVGTETLVIFFV